MYVIKTKFAILPTCLENVLSKARPYMPPSPAGTSYFPIETLSPSHFPAHATHFNPMPSSFCLKTLLSFLVWALPLPFARGSSCGVAGVDRSSEDGTGGRLDKERLAFPPGCLKMPKLRDFLCGCRLHEIVWPAET